MDLLVADPVLLAGFFLFGLDRARGVADVGLAGAEFFEAAAGAGGSTVTRTPEFSAMNCSATASVSGATVLDPSMRIEPDRSSPRRCRSKLSSSLPHAATPKVRMAAEARTPSHLDVTLSPSGCSLDYRPGQVGHCSGPRAACYLRCIEDVKKM